MNAFTIDLLERLAWSIPYFAIVGAGFWICAKHKATHPRLSNTFTLAFTLFAVHATLGPASKAWMANHAYPGESATRVKVGLIYAIASGIAAILNYAGWAALLLGIHRAFKELPGFSGGEIVEVRKDGA